MNAPYFMFAPFDRHFDGGFGVTADAFNHAAETLDKSERASNNHLPIQFLYRHAIELYLKSLIIVLSKRLAIQQNGKWAPPTINTINGPRPLFAIHSIKSLYQHFESLLKSNWATLGPLCHTDWSNIPKELPGWIETIEQHDPKSTFLRYPGLNDSAVERSKSEFQKVAPDEALKQMSIDKSNMALYLTDDNDAISEVFIMQHEPLPCLSAALVSAAKLLSGTHFGMRMEFADGW
jgi:hypothetical protein